MSIEMTSVNTFTSTTCWKCGVTSLLPSHFIAMRMQDGVGFYCPNGHAGYYKDGEISRLKKQLEAAQQRCTSLDNGLAIVRQQRDHAERRAATFRGHVSRLKKRAAAGKCPCCSMKFDDLAAHMKAQHADFGKGSAP